MAGLSPPGLSAARFYYVDEAGDPVLFNRKGKIIVGTPGCSRFFILGLLHVGAPDVLSSDLESLRARLLDEPYFEGVPSMQPRARKTVVAFHAKDDLPEVRREVFAVLMRHELRFQAIVRDKHELVRDVKELNRWNKSYRYSPNELYDDMVTRLLRYALHEAEHANVCFARRGAGRTAALERAVVKAGQGLSRQRNTDTAAAIEVLLTTPREAAGLQAADYLLWALQRLYERHEERYLKFVWSAFRLVIDMDDTREQEHGHYYTQRAPLTLQAVKGRKGT